MGCGQKSNIKKGPYECTKKQIVQMLKHSEVPEDLPHANNTVKWLKILKPDADIQMEIAALGHDIERAVSEEKVHKEDFADYDEFKQRHAENSARIVADIMRRCGWDEASINRVANMIRLHEVGGDEDSDLLRDADGLSFFDTNLRYYFKRHTLDEVKERCQWGYLRISPKLRSLVSQFRYPEKELNLVVQEIVKINTKREKFGH